MRLNFILPNLPYPSRLKEGGGNDMAKKSETENKTETAEKPKTQRAARGLMKKP